MGFFAPWFLAGLAALSVPVYLHLLKQHKSTPYKFASLMFVEQRTQTSVKHRRLKYLALLIMRLLLILLLALTFANLYVNRSPDAIAQGAKHVFVAIDNSFSMRAGGRLDAAKREATALVQSLGSGDRAQVISFAQRASLMTDPVNDKQLLTSAIQSVKQGDGRSAFGELSTTTRTLAGNLQGPVEVHIFTDAQQTSMPTPFGELNQPANVKVVLHPLASKEEGNWFVESVNAPRSVYQAEKVKVQATVAGANTQEGETDVSLLLNGKPVEQKRVKVAPNGRSTVELYIPEVPYGLNRAEVKIATSDPLAEDNVMPFSIERKEPGRVLFVHESRGARAALYYKTALESGSKGALAADSTTPESAGSMDLKKYSLVVLSDVASLGSFEDSLKRYVTAGGSVLVALGPASAIKGRVPVFDEAILESRYETRAGNRFQSASYVDASHQALRRVNEFDGVKFYQTVAVSPGKARVLAKLGDETPLVLEKRVGEGLAMVFASTLDNISNDLPVRASFVPFIDGTAQYLAGIDPAGVNPSVGSVIELRASREQPGAVEVLGPDGQRELSLSEAATAQTFEIPRAGFYEIRKANGRHELVAAHPDRRESVLAPVGKETLDLWSNLGQGTASPQTGTPGDIKSQPYKLWWWFALALLLVTLLESWFGSRYLAGDEESAPARRREAA
jgi:hypothetical protein